MLAGRALIAALAPFQDLSLTCQDLHATRHSGPCVQAQPSLVQHASKAAVPLLHAGDPGTAAQGANVHHAGVQHLCAVWRQACNQNGHPVRRRWTDLASGMCVMAVQVVCCPWLGLACGVVEALSCIAPACICTVHLSGWLFTQLSRCTMRWHQ